MTHYKYQLRLKLVSSNLAFLFLFSCQPDSAQESDLQFDSPFVLAVDGTASHGQLKTYTLDEALHRQEITNQLRFAIGQLGYSNQAMLALADDPILTVTGREQSMDETRDEPRPYFIVHYRAQLKLAWPREEMGATWPKEHTLILPMQADQEGLVDFAETYGAACGGTTSANSLWYYFKPFLPGCPLSGEDPSPMIFRLTLTLQPASENSEGKYPEYGKVWEDGRLDVFFFASNFTVPGAARAGLRLVQHLERSYGSPSLFLDEPGEIFHLVTAEFDTPSGVVGIKVMDIVAGNIQSLDEVGQMLFGQLSAEADLVAYNGHAGLGSHLHRFASLAEFKPGRYYLYWINACRPFAYMDKRLVTGVQSANPHETDPWRYLDLMQTTGIGIYSYGTDIKYLIDVLVGQNMTYREFLTAMPRGWPAVRGEQNNRWPQPFH